MSLVTVPALLRPASQFIISHWWRVPKKSINAARAEFLAWKNANPQGPRPALVGIVPLVIIGKPRTGLKVKTGSRTIGMIPATRLRTFNCLTCNWDVLDLGGGSGDNQPTPNNSVYETGFAGNFDIDPSYIGIDCTAEDGKPRFAVNIVMPSSVSAEAVTGSVAQSYEFSGGDIYNLYLNLGLPCPDSSPCDNSAYNGSVSSEEGNCVASLPPVIGPLSQTTTYAPVQFIQRSRPENFRTLLRARGGDEYSIVGDQFDGGIMFETVDDDAENAGKVVTPDHWHHTVVVLSISSVKSNGSHMTIKDFGTTPRVQSGEEADPNKAGNRFNSVAKMFISYDDENLTKKDLSAYWPKGHKDPNALSTVSGLRIANQTTITGYNIADDCRGHIMSLITKQEYTPSYSYNPPPFEFDSFNFPGSTSFIDAIKEVEMGEFQVYLDEPEFNTSKVDHRRAFIKKSGRPTSLSVTRKFFGREADFILHGVPNWQDGINTGSSAPSDPTTAPGEPVGQIDKYMPDPNLYGDQG